MTRPIRWWCRLSCPETLIVSALLIVACCPGCDQRRRDAEAPPPANPSATASAGDPARSGGSAATARPAVPDARQMSAAQVDAVRAAVEHSGGTLRCGAQGQPLEIDFLASRASVDAAAWQAILNCPALEILRVRAGPIAAPDLAGVCKLVHLRQLHLHDAAVTDALIKELVGSAGQLEQLSLRNTPGVTDQGVAELAALPELIQLALLEQQITGAVTRSLVTMPQLQSLDLRMSHSVRAADLAVLATAPKLAELKLGGSGIDDAALATVARFPHLRRLTVEDAAIGSQGLAQLAAGPAAAQIDELAFARCSALTDDACLVFAKFPRLVSLSLRDVPVTGKFLHQLPSRGQLQRLTLSQTFITGEALDALTTCERLQRLDLSRTYLNLDLTERLARLSSLEHLDLSQCGLDDAMIAPVVEMKHLKTLIVDDNPGLSPEATAKVGTH